MFMIDMHGTLERATASSNSRTPGERYQVVVAGLHARRAARGHLARQLLRVDLDQALAPLYGHAHDRAFAVDQVGLGGKADEVDIVSGERELGPEQGPVRRAHDENLVLGAHETTPPLAE